MEANRVHGPLGYGNGWAVVTLDDDSPVGQAGLRKVSLFEAQAAISYWTVPAARGRGIAAAATGTGFLLPQGIAAGDPGTCLTELVHASHMPLLNVGTVKGIFDHGRIVISPGAQE